MAISPGTRLGSYEIVAPLGAGGMGEIHRARDTKLGREVALKILPEAFASDPNRLMRFEREARTLASLNHPNIAQVYGVEDGPSSGVGPAPSTGSGRGATRALVMELGAGEDLSTRIARGPIPLDEALPIARQVAEALEAAHEAGIIHRDLKPANVKALPGTEGATNPAWSPSGRSIAYTQSPSNRLMIVAIEAAAPEPDVREGSRGPVPRPRAGATSV